jgi:hypothetical protein
MQVAFAPVLTIVCAISPKATCILIFVPRAIILIPVALTDSHVHAHYPVVTEKNLTKYPLAHPFFPFPVVPCSCDPIVLFLPYK